MRKPRWIWFAEALPEDVAGRLRCVGRRAPRVDNVTSGPAGTNSLADYPTLLDVGLGGLLARGAGVARGSRYTRGAGCSPGDDRGVASLLHRHCALGRRGGSSRRQRTGGRDSAWRPSRLARSTKAVQLVRSRILPSRARALRDGVGARRPVPAAVLPSRHRGRASHTGQKPWTSSVICG